MELDGPLMIPGLYNGKNRTFFMVAYEGVRANAIQSPIASVPTALMRQGNFSQVTTPIRDPRTGQPFPGHIIPASRLSPTALRSVATRLEGCRIPLAPGRVDFLEFILPSGSLDARTRRIDRHPILPQLSPTNRLDPRAAMENLHPRSTPSEEKQSWRLRENAEPLPRR